MGKELNLTRRPIVYSCSWPAYMISYPEMVNTLVDYNLIGKHCNLWRNFDDISRSWWSIKRIIDYYDHNQDKLIPAQGPGRWHDPDMVGWLVGCTEAIADPQSNYASEIPRRSTNFALYSDVSVVFQTFSVDCFGIKIFQKRNRTFCSDTKNRVNRY
ncbi:unnamed protein product [Anisakis simplex]|uniref:Alpha-galactosidase n=1 Tax=Anisakis simplex TaxID=6269 RepID=A0A0M3JBY0_ANISI|nr:unnamed protein product [Anisakis simplex]